MMKTNGEGLPKAIIPGTRTPDVRWMKTAVLRAMREHDVFTITAACKRAGIRTQIFYAWRKNDAEFAEEVKVANDEITERLEQKAHEQAVGVHGTEPVPSLMIFLLKARKPEMYRDNTEASLSLTGPNGAMMQFTLNLGDRGNAP